MRLYNYLDLSYSTIVIFDNNKALLLMFSHVFFEKNIILIIFYVFNI